jgi:hypothetical protein
MEMIEGIIWITTGFISTLITMEVAWRLAREQTKRTSINQGKTDSELRALIQSKINER